MAKYMVAICGCGRRGLDAYAPYAKLHPDRMEVTAGADPRPERLEKLRAGYGVAAERCFASDEELLAQPKLAADRGDPGQDPREKRPGGPG